MIIFVRKSSCYRNLLANWISLGLWDFYCLEKYCIVLVQHTEFCRICLHKTQQILSCVQPTYSFQIKAFQVCIWQMIVEEFSLRCYASVFPRRSMYLLLVVGGANVLQLSLPAWSEYHYFSSFFNLSQSIFADMMTKTMTRTEFSGIGRAHLNSLNIWLHLGGYWICFWELPFCRPSFCNR